jgi:hypothetical protein
MNDRFTKLILIAIALGLWANAALTFMRPTPAAADDVDYRLRSMDGHLSNIEFAIEHIGHGT